LRRATKNMIFTEIVEDELKIKIKGRTRQEWIKLYTRRIILMFINTCILASSAYLIVLTNIRKGEL